MWPSNLNAELDRLCPDWRMDRPNDLSKRALVAALQALELARKPRRGRPPKDE